MIRRRDDARRATPGEVLFSFSSLGVPPPPSVYYFRTSHSRLASRRRGFLARLLLRHHAVQTLRDGISPRRPAPARGVRRRLRVRLLRGRRLGRLGRLLAVSRSVAPSSSVLRDVLVHGAQTPVRCPDRGVDPARRGHAPR